MPKNTDIIKILFMGHFLPFLFIHALLLFFRIQQSVCHIDNKRIYGLLKHYLHPVLIVLPTMWAG